MSTVIFIIAAGLCLFLLAVISLIEAVKSVKPD